MDRDWFFYIVRCKDNSLYSGITVNIEGRLIKHNNGTGAKYTSTHRPVTLVYSEKYSSFSEARKREIQIKGWPKIKKEKLILGFYPERAKRAEGSTTDMDKKIKAYIDKQKSPQKEICLKIREIILKTFPDIKEEMKWGVPVFGGGKYYIGALRDHVNLGFAIAGLTKKDLALFEGNGKTMRHLKIKTLKDLDKRRIVKLLKLAGECSDDC
jgi:predicted GIY-YIG superfamily endonuclease